MAASVLTARALAAVLGLALVLGAAPAAAADKRVPESRAEIELSYAPVVKQVAPAVVNIYAQRVVQQSIVSPLFDDPFFKQFFGDGGPFGQRERIQNSLGSGVIVRPEGYVVTNNHVIAEAEAITVVLSDRREYAAEVVLRDERTDLAVLKIDPRGEVLPAVDLGDSDALEVGDLVLAVGNPFGVGQTVTSGIVSALARTSVGISDFQSFIQTDAAINPGNSGGALVTMDGRLVGINTAIFSKTGGSVGIGFAVPVNMVGAVLRAAVSGGDLVRPWLGVSASDITAEMAEAIGLKRVGGVIVEDFHPASPAPAAGIETGDVITAVDGNQIYDGQDLRFRLATMDIGETAELTLVRNGSRMVVPVKLTPPPEDPPRDITELEGPHPFDRVTVGNLSPKFASELSFPETEGVVILEVGRGSPAGFLDLRPGDIVLAVNGERTPSVDTLEQAVRGGGREWSLEIKRGQNVIERQFRM